jgi:septation ring formation regulator EzrA
MTKALEELERLKKLEQEVRESLQAIGPSHVLYAPLMDELDTLRAHLKTIEKLSKL